MGKGNEHLVDCSDLEEAKAFTKSAYEFLEKLEAKTWCKATQTSIQNYLREVGYWPEVKKAKQEEAVL